MYSDYAFAMEEAMSGVILSLITNAGSSLVGIAVYVFTALSLYTIAKRREISKPWMAWIPVVNCWILGSISDQYRYVAKGETRNKRKTLLILNIINCVLAIAFVVGLFVMMFNVVENIVMYNMMDEEEMLIQIMKSLGGMMGMILPLFGISIAYAIISYMALYDVYASCDPNNKVLYLVLGIFFGIAQAICLFICRNKDGGMPPRKEVPGAANYYGGQNPYGQNQYYGQSPYRQNPYSQQYQQYGQYQPNQQQTWQQPQYQAPGQVPQQPQYQAPQQAEPILSTQEIHKPQQEASPYSQWPDPYAPQHPEKNGDAPEQL